MSHIETASKLISNIFPSISSSFFDSRGDQCFCNTCHLARKDKSVYYRGAPSKPYALPIGWVRIGLKTDNTECKNDKVWENWHVAFHGTNKQTIPKIFKSGLCLLKPGDINTEGDDISIHTGHIKKPFCRRNKYTKQNEIFDPNQIFISPSIKYSSHEAYTEWYYCTCPNNDQKYLQIKFAFQLRVRPDSYCIGQQTVGATEKLDFNFNNNSIEWYTKDSSAIILNGLLLKIETCSNLAEWGAGRVVSLCDTYMDSIIKTLRCIENRNKPYHCNVCSKRFDSRYALSTHQQIHIGEKAFKCSICLKRFATKHGLGVHQASSSCFMH